MVCDLNGIWTMFARGLGWILKQWLARIWATGKRSRIKYTEKAKKPKIFKLFIATAKRITHSLKEFSTYFNTSVICKYACMPKTSTPFVEWWSFLVLFQLSLSLGFSFSHFLHTQSLALFVPTFSIRFCPLPSLVLSPYIPSMAFSLLPFPRMRINRIESKCFACIWRWIVKLSFTQCMRTISILEYAAYRMYRILIQRDTAVNRHCNNARDTCI